MDVHFVTMPFLKGAKRALERICIFKGVAMYIYADTESRTLLAIKQRGGEWEYPYKQFVNDVKLA